MILPSWCSGPTYVDVNVARWALRNALGELKKWDDTYTEKEALAVMGTLLRCSISVDIFQDGHHQALYDLFTQAWKYR